VSHQLQATAASHDTMDILNPSFTPSANDAVAFKQKERFMYNVFSQCGKVCVWAHEKDLDAQKVYKDLLAFAVRQAITTELIISGIRGKVSTLPWDNFYNMVLSTAKLLDNAAPKPKEQQHQANAAQPKSGRLRQ
jgi:hypothetical protein